MPFVKWVPNAMVEDGREHYLEPDVVGGTLEDYAPAQASSRSVGCLWRSRWYPREKWSSVRPHPGDTLTYTTSVEGVEILVGLVVSIVVSALSYAYQKNYGPKPPKALVPKSEPAVHTFSGIQTKAESGATIPVVYGIHAVGGNILQYAVEGTAISSEVSEDFPVQSRLNVLLGLAEGEIIGIDSIEINGNDITAYDLPGQGALYYESRKGIPNQAPINIQGFSDETRSSNPVGQDLPNPTDVEAAIGTEFEDDIIVYKATDQEVNKVYINIEHPLGLFHAPGAVTVSQTVSWDVRYRRVGDVDWQPWETFAVTRAIRQSFLSTCKIDLPERDFYEFEVRKRSVQPPDISYSTDIKFDSIVETVAETFSYPNTALLGFSVAASGSLQGSQIPRVRAVLHGKKVEKWDPDTETWSFDINEFRNPAWCVIDALTNRRYGMGAQYDRDRDIDLDAFVAFAEYCNEYVPDGTGSSERRHQADIVFEGGESGWESAMRMLANARAFPITIGEKVSVVWQHQRPVLYRFDTSNMLRHSFRKTRQSRGRRPTRCEARFLNAARDYEIDTMPSDDPELQTKDLPLIVEAIDAFGVTSDSAAARLALYHVNKRRLNTVVSFKTKLEGLPVQVGDLIGVSHELPQWGVATGRCMAGTAPDRVVIDNNVELLEGETYEIAVVHHGGNVQDRLIVMPPGSYGPGDEIFIDTDFIEFPEEFERWRIGRLQGSEVILEVTSVKLEESLDIEITGFIWDERILLDASTTIEPPTFTELPDPSTIPGCLASPPTLLERLEGLVPVVDVSWAYTDDPNVWGARILARRTSGVPTGWEVRGTVESPISTFTMNGVQSQETYEVSVLQISEAGAMLSPLTCARSTITIDGLGPVLDPPANLQVVKSGDQLQIAWDPVPGSPAFYEVRRGEVWVMSQPVGTSPTPSLLTPLWAPVGSGAPGVERIRVRAVSSTGLYGQESVVEVTFADWYGGAFVHVDRDEFTLTWPGTLTNLQADTDGFLEPIDRSLVGVYETPEIEVGASPLAFRLGALVWARLTDGPAQGLILDPLQSYQGKLRGMHGPIDPAQWIGTLSVEFRAADSTVDLAAAAYSPLLTLNVVARYVQLRISIATTDTDWLPRLDYLQLTAEGIPTP